MPTATHYVLNGQKTWSTRALFANWLFGLFRSDPASSSRHHGLTYLLVPLNAPGVTIRPIQALNGKQAFAEIFLDDVKVPVDNRIGAEGQGWNVAMATAGFERGLLLRSPARFQQTARRLVQLYKANQAQADRDPSIRDAVLSCWSASEAYALSAYHMSGVWRKAPASVRRPAPTRFSGPNSTCACTKPPCAFSAHVAS